MSSFLLVDDAMINVIVLFAVIVVGVMHVCDRARGDCKRSPACTVYGDGNTTANLRINMLARPNDTDFCGVYINDVSLFRQPLSLFLNLIETYPSRGKKKKKIKKKKKKKKNNNNREIHHHD